MELPVLFHIVTQNSVLENRVGHRTFQNAPLFLGHFCQQGGLNVYIRHFLSKPILFQVRVCDMVQKVIYASALFSKVD